MIPLEKLESTRDKKCKYCGNKIGVKQVIHDRYCSEACYEWATNTCFICGKDLKNRICKPCISKIAFNKNTW